MERVESESLKEWKGGGGRGEGEVGRTQKHRHQRPDSFSCSTRRHFDGLGDDRPVVGRQRARQGAGSLFSLGEKNHQQFPRKLDTPTNFVCLVIIIV